MEKLLPFNGVDWLLVSSPSSAEILLSFLLKSSFDLRKLPKIISCGPGSSEPFKRYGVIPDAEAEAPYGAEALLALCEKLLKRGERVLRLRSDAAGESLAAGLRKLGAEVEDAIIYRNIAIKRESLPDFDCAFFSSSSEVRAFVESFGPSPLKGKLCAAIGNPTLEALKSLAPGSEAFAPEASTAAKALEALAWRNIADILRGLPPPH